MNLILAAAAMNFKRQINLRRTEALIRWLLLYKYFIEVCKNFYTSNLETTFSGTTNYKKERSSNKLLRRSQPHKTR